MAIINIVPAKAKDEKGKEVQGYVITEEYFATPEQLKALLYVEEKK